MKKEYGIKDLKKLILTTMAVGVSLAGSMAFASDNVLQAIQIDGVKDSYNVILRSDDNAELKKTIQAPNKMVLTLKGIRASKSINTIYNNTATVDSVVVEPIGEDTVKILIQADNVSEADVHFDTLKTPLGVLGNSETQNKDEELVLNKPMHTYKPVYDESNTEEESGLSLNGIMSSSTAQTAKKALKNEKISFMVMFGMFAMFMLAGMKLIKGKDNEIKVGLSQSLKERELELYRSNMGVTPSVGETIRPSMNYQPQSNYGLKAYQNGSKSPYMTPETLRPRPALNQPQPQTMAQPSAYDNIQRQAIRQQQPINKSVAVQNTIQKQAPAAPKSKTTNIDSIKFLESMTKIYEKNGRADLAQELKSNLKKAKINIA